MSKTLKKIMIIFAILVLSLLVLLYWMDYIAEKSIDERNYMQRLQECSAKELIPDLEKTFDINFPDDIEDVKTAKTIPIDGTIMFALKFAAKPETVSKFFSSLPEQIRLYKEEYLITRDRRADKHYPPPEWFTMAIRNGNIIFYSLAGGKVTFYIAAENQDKYIVYLDGFF